jgi:hypothetical protein
MLALVTAFMIAAWGIDGANAAQDEPATKPAAGVGTVLKEKQVFGLRYKVLDRFGTPVPNAQVKVIALDEKGQPYGSGFIWMLPARTGANGCAASGCGTSPPLKPGSLRVVAEHPSIGEAHKDCEWKDALHPNHAYTADGDPIVLKAEGGPGLLAWRTEAAAKSPQLVAALDKADKNDQVASLTKEIAAQEMQAVPTLLQALNDYDNPQRQRFVHALLATWNGCLGMGPLDSDVRAKARAIYDVLMYDGVLREKPQITLHFFDRINTFPREYTAQAVKEIEWVIRRRRTQMASVGGGEAAMVQKILEKWEDQLAKIKEALTTMPAEPASRPAKAENATQPAH